jgi:tripartite ATP-independent transporter DctP family solute receptor
VKYSTFEIRNITWNLSRVGKYTAFIFLFFALFSGCTELREKRYLKLAHTLPPDHPVHKAMVFMGQRCAELSNGKMEIEIYPSEQLGSEQQCVELLQIGSLAITKVSAAVMESFTEDYKVLGLPYIFRDSSHAVNVLDGEIGQELLLSTEDRYIRGLCFYDAGSRSFYTIDKPILKPSDLDGMKIRVMKSKTAMDMVKALGGSPTPISYGELYTALQSGVVDGAENNPPSFYTSHHYEVCKYYALDEHTAVPDVLIISQHIWKKLSDQEKEWIQQAATESVAVERKLWSESVKKSLMEVQKAGVTIYYPDKSLFAEKVNEVYDSYKNQERLYKYIKRIQATN